MKQVPACEYNPFEAIQTNVLGSQHIVDAAIDNGVKTVVALSTDKAVNPVNLYGATKLCEEKLIVQGNVRRRLRRQAVLVSVTATSSDLVDRSCRSSASRCVGPALHHRC